MSNTLELFKKPRALDSVKDRELRFDGAHPYHFAAGQMMAPVAAAEAALLAREVAIAFGSTPGSLPLAILGRQHGQNSYVRPNGHWQGRYVPAHFRRYPFVLAERAAGVAGGEGAQAVEQVVVVDDAAPHLGSTKGERLFDEQGTPSEVLRKVVRVLQLLQQQTQQTVKLVAQLESLGLLVPRVLEIAAHGAGERVNLQGLRVVDFDKLGALAPQQLAELRDSGALELAYAHRASLANLESSTLVEQEAPVSSGSSGSISFEGIDWSKF